MKDRLLNILMLAAVAAALILSYVKGAPAADGLSPSPAVTALPTVHPVTVFRGEREQVRAREKKELTALAQDGTASEESRFRAQEALSDMLRADETELAVEAVLAAKGYADALCVYRQGSLTVLLGSEIRDTDARLILDLAKETAGIEKENVRISGY